MFPINTNNDVVLNAYGCTVPSLLAIHANGLEYLLQNGFSQSIGDAGTSAAAKAVADYAKAWAKDDTPLGATKEMIAAAKVRGEAQAKVWKDTPEGQAVIEAAMVTARQRRMDAICDGSMVYGARGPNGPRLSPLEQYLQDTAESFIGAQAKAKGAKMPKGEELEAMVARVLAVKQAAWEKDFVKLTKGGEDLDLF